MTYEILTIGVSPTNAVGLLLAFPSLRYLNVPYLFLFKLFRYDG